MKKISLLSIVLIMCAMLNAQNTTIGLKAGLNVGNLNSSNGNEMGSKLGMNAGLIGHIHLSSKFALQPELIYSDQGAKYTISNGEHSLHLNYINIPVLLQYMFSNGFRLQTGPQLGFLASVKDKLGNVTTGYYTSQSFKTVDFSWSVGLGYMASSGLGIDGRYNFGLTDIRNASTTILHNRVFQLGLFYMLNSSTNRKTIQKHY